MAHLRLSRPHLPRRNTSYSKRHASFDSPREVPLPPPPATAPATPHPVFDDDVPDPPTSSLIYSYPRTYSLLDNNQIPYMLDRFSSASLPLPDMIPYGALPSARNQLSTNPDTAEGTASPNRPELRRHPLSDSSSSSGSYNSTSSDSSPNSPSRRCSDATPPSSIDSVSIKETQQPAVPSPKPASPLPFRAPQPPVSSPVSPSSHPTAMRQVPAPSPRFPPPEPPTILTTDTVSEIDGTNGSIARPWAPHEPFLSHAPPPPDSWIQVETTHAEYKLIVRLPGFNREGITLSTKRRRILHVVADSWDNGGGHFERRISFGYDADLVQVRAEFDGEMLKVTIPRRVLPISLTQ